MSSWLSVPACWWLSFCFTSSSPVATHPKRPYSLVINTALSLSQPGNMLPNTLTLQVNLCAVTFCWADFDISRTFTPNQKRCRLGFRVTFSKLLKTDQAVNAGSPAPTPPLQLRRPPHLRRGDLGTQSPNRSVYSFCSFCNTVSLNAGYRQQEKKKGGQLLLRDLTQTTSLQLKPGRIRGAGRLRQWQRCEGEPHQRGRLCGRHISMIESHNPKPPPPMLLHLLDVIDKHQAVLRIIGEAGGGGGQQNQTRLKGRWRGWERCSWKKSESPQPWVMQQKSYARIQMCPQQPLKCLLNLTDTIKC